MDFLERVEIENREKISLIKEMKRLSEFIDADLCLERKIIKDIKSNKTSIDNYNDPLIEEFLHNENINGNIRRSFKIHKDRLVTKRLSLIRKNEGDLLFCSNRSERNRSRLRVISERNPEILKKLNREVVLENVKKSLSSFPNVDEERCSLYMREDIPHLQVYVNNIYCTSNNTVYKNIIDKKWLLPPILLDFNLIDGFCEVVGDPRDLRDLPLGYSSSKVHPHILRQNQPCYGDFLGAVIDAQNELDISQMVTIMILFLEQANAEDDAGAFYPRFMMFAGDQSGVFNSIYNQCERISLGDNGCFYAKIINRDVISYMRIPVVENERTTVYEILNNFFEIEKFITELKLPKEQRSSKVILLENTEELPPF